MLGAAIYPYNAAAGLPLQFGFRLNTELARTLATTGHTIKGNFVLEDSQGTLLERALELNLYEVTPGVFWVTQIYLVPRDQAPGEYKFINGTLTLLDQSGGRISLPISQDIRITVVKLDDHVLEGVKNLLDSKPSE